MIRFILRILGRRDLVEELRAEIAELELQTRRQALAFAFIRERGLSLEWGTYLNGSQPVAGVWDQLRADELRIAALVRG